MGLKSSTLLQEEDIEELQNETGCKYCIGTRNSSQNKFIELLPNTETYKNSYFCRTIKDWNALPSEIVNIKSADRFKEVLYEYFSHNEF